MTARSISEYQEQVNLFAWAAWCAPRARELSLLLAIPNGEKRAAVTGARLKASGVKAGVPDILLPVMRNGAGALWIELKAPGGRARPAQIEWIDRLNDEGHEALVCVGWQAAARAICDYLDIAPGEVGL